MAETLSSLDPAVLDRLSGLSLVARTVVEGFMAGHHTSPHRGSSVEFAQHREYVPGDELRRVDWKVFARNDRLVVKEFVEETNLICHVCVDASESMAFGSEPWTKFDYARWGAAALTHLVLMQRDTVGLVLFDSADRLSLPPANGAPQRHAVLEALEAAEAKGPTGIGNVLNLLGPRLRRRGIVAIFSDFFDDPQKILEGVKRLKYAGHEPILFQVIDPVEETFSIESLVKLQGLENSGIQKIDPKAIRQAYREEIERHNSLLARQARSMSVDFVRVSTGEPLDAILSTYLAQRTNRARGGRR